VSSLGWSRLPIYVGIRTEGKVLAQLKAKNYAEKYKSRKETRSVVGFEVETLAP
jgi:hypothetical protein